MTIWIHRAPFVTKTFAWQQVDEAFDIFLLIGKGLLTIFQGNL